MKKVFVLLSVLIFQQGYSQQNVVGCWYGIGNVANSGNASNYMLELLLQQNGASVQGIVNYYFKNTFRSFKINGYYNTTTRYVTFNNIPVTYFGSPVGMEVDCPMDFVGQLRVSQVASNLKGSFISRGTYKNTCPEILFDLKLNKDAGNQDSVLLALQQFKETYQVWSPSANDTVVAATVQQRTVVNYVIQNEYKQRENVIAHEIEVESDSLSIDFYDNGEVDGDSISVFFNDQLLTFNRLLSTRAIHFSIKLEAGKEINEMAMFANNLGRIPPNTALMVVSDGKKRYEVRMLSNLEKNSVLRIRRKKSGG